MFHTSITAAADDRRAGGHRFPAGRPIGLRPHGSEAVEAELLNISSGGFMATTRALLSPGMRVWLRLPGAPRVNASVLWTDGDRVGGAFVEAIDPLEVLHAAGAGAA